jgi:hypothetical protein
MTQTPRIVYRARDDATPEAQASALSNIYRLILGGAESRGRLPDKNAPDDAKGPKHDRANYSIHR